MIVDTNTHIWSAPHQMVSTAVSRLRGDREPWQHLDSGDSTHARAAETVQVSIVHGLESRHAKVSVPCKQVAEAVEQNPQKRLGFAGLDPLAPSMADNLDHAVQLGLVGVSISPAGQNMHPCHSRAMQLYDQCQHRKLPVYVHGVTLFGDRAQLAYAKPESFDEIASNFGQLRLVIAEMGRPWVEPTMWLISQHQHVYADVSGLVGEPWQLYHALLLAHQYGAADKLLFASGFPFCSPRQAILNLYSINLLAQGTNLPTVPRQLLNGIVNRDTLECLDIDAPAVSTEPAADQDPQWIKEMAT